MYKEIDVGKSESILAYADDIAVLGETEDDMKLATEVLILSAMTIESKINENKTKYMCITRERPQTHQTMNKEYKFEKVNTYKYLGTEINSQNSNHE
jgi:hypothetical protein